MMLRGLIVWLLIAAAAAALACANKAAAPGSTATSPADPTASAEPALWKTYESPLGFTLRYPPSWTVRVGDTEGLPLGQVKILNPLRAENTAIEGGRSGEAWIQVSPRAVPTFDVEEIAQTCRPTDAPPEAVTVQPVTVAGLSAVICSQEGPSVYDPEQHGKAKAYYIDLPSDIVLGIVAYSLDGDEATTEVLDTILLSFSLS